jgi:hypothetical protein
MAERCVFNHPLTSLEMASLKRTNDRDLTFNKDTRRSYEIAAIVVAAMMKPSAGINGRPWSGRKLMFAKQIGILFISMFRLLSRRYRNRSTLQLSCCRRSNLAW